MNQDLLSDLALAKLFAALGHPSRVAIFKRLLCSGAKGEAFGSLSASLEIPPSTLTHHLREIENGGVLLRRSVGRSTVFCLDLPVLAAGFTAMMSLCCTRIDEANMSGEGA